MSTEISKSHSYIAQEEACKLGTRFPYYGHLMLVVCSVDAPALFIECPSGIHWVFKLCSLSVQVVLIMPFASLSQSFAMHLWYFSDTSMILYVKRNEKYHLCNVLFISLIAKNLMQKWDFDTFFKEKHFSCVRKSSARRSGGYLLIIIPLQQSHLSNLFRQHNLSQNYKGNPEDILRIQL